MIQAQQRLFDRPYLTRWQQGPQSSQPPQEEGTQIQHAGRSAHEKQFETVNVEYCSDNLNSKIITNPRAIVGILSPELLNGGLSETGLCQILENLTNIVNGCLPNNALALMNLVTQPVQHLKVEKPYFENLDVQNIDQSDVMCHFLHQNDINLYKSSLQEYKQKLRK